MFTNCERDYLYIYKMFIYLLEINDRGNMGRQGSLKRKKV